MYIAGIVLFNPDLGRLKSNIDGIAPQVDLIYCVDNGSNNECEAESLLSNCEKVILKKNGNNKGIAIALNQIAEFASENGAEWVLTLDQDSEPQPGLIKAYEKQLPELTNAGMLTCVIEDRNTHKRTQTTGSSCAVNNCITSGSYLNLKAWKEVGGFDEKMFIDYVDFDMCQMLHEAGYGIYRINHYGLYHEVGRSKVVRFIGREEICYGHSAFREYYCVRNHIYYARKHQKYLNKWKEYIRVLKHILIVIIYGNDKFCKVKKMLKGIVDAGKM